MCSLSFFLFFNNNQSFYDSKRERESLDRREHFESRKLRRVNLLLKARPLGLLVILKAILVDATNQRRKRRGLELFSPFACTPELGLVNIEKLKKRSIRFAQRNAIDLPRVPRHTGDDRRCPSAHCNIYEPSNGSHRPKHECRS